MSHFSHIPNIIYSLWGQGEDAAPEITRYCFNRWRKLNPEFELKILCFSDVKEILRKNSIVTEGARVQALSDIVRANVLATQGGIWIDASVLPIKPLKDWLPDVPFFAFEKPGPDRPLSS